MSVGFNMIAGLVITFLCVVMNITVSIYVAKNRKLFWGGNNKVMFAVLFWSNVFGASLNLGILIGKIISL